MKHPVYNKELFAIYAKLERSEEEQVKLVISISLKHSGASLSFEDNEEQFESLFK